MNADKPWLIKCVRICETNGQITISVSRSFTAIDLSTAVSFGFSEQATGDNGLTSQLFRLTLSSSGGSKTWSADQSAFSSTYKQISAIIASTPTSSTGTLNLAAVTGYTWTYYVSNFGFVTYSVTMYVDQ